MSNVISLESYLPDTPRIADRRRYNEMIFENLGCISAATDISISMPDGMLRRIARQANYSNRFLTNGAIGLGVSVTVGIGALAFGFNETANAALVTGSLGVLSMAVGEIKAHLLRREIANHTLAPPAPRFDKI